MAKGMGGGKDQERCGEWVCCGGGRQVSLPPSRPTWISSCSPIEGHRGMPAIVTPAPPVGPFLAQTLFIFQFCCFPSSVCPSFLLSPLTHCLSLFFFSRLLSCLSLPSTHHESSSSLSDPLFFVHLFVSPGFCIFPFLPLCFTVCSLSFFWVFSSPPAANPVCTTPFPWPFPLLCPHSLSPSMTSSLLPRLSPLLLLLPPLLPSPPHSGPLSSSQLWGQHWRASHICLIVLLWLLDIAHLDSGAQMCGCYSDLGPSGKYGRPPAPEQRTK